MQSVKNIIPLRGCGKCEKSIKKPIRLRDLKKRAIILDKRHRKVVEQIEYEEWIGERKEFGMYYKIGTLAKRFGITTQALRFYEAQGFLTPVREETSTTRRYQARNLKWLSSIRRYHELGFGMEEIQKLFFCEEPGQLKKRMEEKELETIQEIQALEKRLKALRQQQDDMARIDVLLHRCELEASSCLWVLIDQEGQTLDESKDVEKITQAWMKELAFVYSASIVPGEAVARDDRMYERKSGFCIEAPMAQELKLPDGEGVKKIQYDCCIHTITKLSEEESFMGHVVKYAEDNHLKITGDAIGRCLIKVGESNCQKKEIIPKAVYYEYWIPVETTKM